MFNVKVIAHSLAPCGKECLTIEATYPRFIHSEVMTHRDRARNAASSRAIPWGAMCQRIENDPVIPIKWGSKAKGMQTGEEIPAHLIPEAQASWLRARDACLEEARFLDSLGGVGVHKSITNRLTETWMWITVVMTATKWNNFFRLRCHPDAEIHFQKLADMIRDAKIASIPVKLLHGDWHLPYIENDDWRLFEKKETWTSYGLTKEETEIIVKKYINLDIVDILKRASTARCSRVSYMTHGTTKKNIWKDLIQFDRLFMGSGFGHWSPMEHPCQALNIPQRSGPFVGFKQFRKEFPDLENVEG